MIYVYSNGPTKKTSFKVISNSLVGLYFSKSFFGGVAVYKRIFVGQPPYFGQGNLLVSAFDVPFNPRTSGSWLLDMNERSLLQNSST